MPNCLFQFKQFSIWSHLGGFKVGTDAVLLGAWADVSSNQNILEIGAGTGVVSLMMAQRTNASIHAVEVDKAAADQAKYNFQHARFGGLKLNHSSIQDFAENIDARFDHIVCNPPYFEFSSKPDSDTMLKAKHTDGLAPEDLLKCVGMLVSTEGGFSAILPFGSYEKWNALAESHGFKAARNLLVRPLPENGHKRVLVEWRKGFGGATEITDITLEKGGTEVREYTSEFKRLLSDYFIRF